MQPHSHTGGRPGSLFVLHCALKSQHKRAVPIPPTSLQFCTTLHSVSVQQNQTRADRKNNRHKNRCSNSTVHINMINLMIKHFKFKVKAISLAYKGTKTNNTAKSRKETKESPSELSPAWCTRNEIRLYKLNPTHMVTP